MPATKSPKAATNGAATQPGMPRPLFDRVLLERVTYDDERKTPGGLVLPSTAHQEQPNVARVIAVGPGKRRPDGTYEPISVKVGDKVIFAPYAGNDVRTGHQFSLHGDGARLIISEVDILAVIDE